MSLPGPTVAIVGPTASGKSALAEEIAVALSTSVVSVDAMQVYRGMDIGTAKTPPAARVCPLLMVDVVGVDDSYSVQRYQRDARACVDVLLAQGKVPVLCGGTGLYLNALVDEMDFPPGKVGGDRRIAYEEMVRREGADAVYGLLEERDPESARLIHPNNVRRVIRALELCDERKSYARQHEGLHERAPHYACQIWGISLERERLYRRIERRVDEMFEQGLVEEVSNLRDRGLGETLTARQAIGYTQVLDYLDGTCSLKEARDEIVLRTRRYAKRQISWFRHDGRVQWLDFETMDRHEAARVVIDSLKGDGAAFRHMDQKGED